MTQKRRGRLLLAAGILTLAVLTTPSLAQAKEDARPNVLIILADDMGYSDTGAFGGEIATPNIDALAERGLRLDRFYVSPACSPTRAMLLTGRDNHRVGLGSMAEILTDQQRGRPGYEGYLHADVPTLAERLEAAGYATMMSGKWHLGKDKARIPAARGFGQSFALLQGAHNHFGFDQSAAYRRYGAATDYRLNGAVAEWPEGGYSSDVFAERMIEFLGNVPKGKPFFAYLAFTAPHWPLQAPADVVAKYRGKYDAGPNAVREARVARMQALGLASAEAPHRSLTTDWDGLSDAARETEARKMEIYAAMIDRMDTDIGRVLEALRRSGRLDHTIVLFLSDNGPDILSLNRPLNPNNVSEPMKVPLDNSLGNLGAADSYVSYGPIWAAVSATPFAGGKGDTLEGGIRAPAIVAGPGVRHGVSAALLHVTDIFPTVLELAGVPADTTLPGRSWASFLAGRQESPRAPDAELNWELFYRAAARKGDMKAVFLPNRIPLYGAITPPGSVRWELYDMARDPGETRDLATEEPETLRALHQQWLRYARDNGVVLLPEDEEPAPGQ